MAAYLGNDGKSSQEAMCSRHTGSSLRVATDSVHAGRLSIVSIMVDATDGKSRDMVLAWRSW